MKNMTTENTGRNTIERKKALLEAYVAAGGRDLHNVITVSEFTDICNTCQGDSFDPFDLDDMAGCVADDHGVDDSLPLPPFIMKLINLSEIQRLALREMVERYWYQGSKDGLSVEQFLIANGVISLN